MLRRLVAHSDAMLYINGHVFVVGVPATVYSVSVWLCFILDTFIRSVSCPQCRGVIALRLVHDQAQFEEVKPKW